jgi:hypothetical protein
MSFVGAEGAEISETSTGTGIGATNNGWCRESISAVRSSLSHGALSEVIVSRAV